MQRQNKDNFIQKLMEFSQDDYLNFMSVLKETRKCTAELEFLSIFNTKIKNKSKKEIVKLLQKTINEINNIINTLECGKKVGY